MKHFNVNIIGTGIYHPENKVLNDYFIDYYEKKDIDIRGLLSYLGRDERYKCNEEENVITMGAKAAAEALGNAKITPEEIDMIIFATDTPEYTAPCNAIKVSNELGTVNAHVVYDMNNNCVGIITALDNASRFMKSNKKIRKALLIGSQKIASFARPDDPMAYSGFGDGAGAIVLEAMEENEERGLVESAYYTDAKHHNMALMPACGYSKITRKDISDLDKKWWTDPTFRGDHIIEIWNNVINQLLHNNDLEANHIDDYIFSQFCRSHIVEIIQRLKVDPDKFTYIGDRYGYTGVASPIFAMHHAIENCKIKKDSKIILCSVGSGFTCVSLLWKF